MRLAIVAVCFAVSTLSSLSACELIDAVDDRVGGDPGSTNIDGGPDSVPVDPTAATPTAPTTNPTTPTPATPTPAAPTPAALPAAPIAVTLDVRLRYVAVNGQLLAEAEFTWTTSGGGNVVVDVQAKSDLAYPSWTDLLTDLAATDVASTLIDANRQDWHFRAVATDLDDPTRTATSSIVSIRQ
jgi:hypothetical protein